MTGYAGPRYYVGTPQSPWRTSRISVNPTQKWTPTLSQEFCAVYLLLQFKLFATRTEFLARGSESNFRWDIQICVGSSAETYVIPRPGVPRHIYMNYHAGSRDQERPFIIPIEDLKHILSCVNSPDAKLISSAHESYSSRCASFQNFYFVFRFLVSYVQCTLVPYSESNFLQGTRTTRPCLSGQVVPNQCLKYSVSSIIRAYNLIHAVSLTFEWFHVGLHYRFINSET